MSKCAFPSFSKATGIGFRVAIHQACMMPYIQFTLLFVSGMMQSGAGTFKERLDAGQTRFSEKWRIGFSASLCYWPVVNTVMYTLVQPRFMNLYADLASLVFASVMSYITYSDCTFALDKRSAVSSASTKLPTRESLALLTDKIHQRISMKAILLKDGDSAVSRKEPSDQQLNWLLSTQT